MITLALRLGLSNYNRLWQLLARRSMQWDNYELMLWDDGSPMEWDE